jgi:hypothetical protein
MEGKKPPPKEHNFQTSQTSFPTTSILRARTNTLSDVQNSECRSQLLRIIIRNIRTVQAKSSEDAKSSHSELPKHRCMLSPP